MTRSKPHRLSTFPSLVWTLLLAACGGGGGGGPTTSGGGGPTTSGVATSGVATSVVFGNGRRKPDTSPDDAPQNSAPAAAPSSLVYVQNQAHSIRDISEKKTISHRVFENHPVDKPVMYLPQLKDVFLPFGLSDNNLFKITSHGEIVFRNAPDYESPADRQYTLQILGLDAGGNLVRQPISISVLDIQNEKTGQSNPSSMYKFTRYNAVQEKPANLNHTHQHNHAGEAGHDHEDDHDHYHDHSHPNEPGHNHDHDHDHNGADDTAAGLVERFPKADVAKVIWGQHWVMPATGPLVLTWSFKVRGFIQGLAVSEEDKENQRQIVERALLKFEAVTNILFIEVDDSDGRTGHLQFETSTDRIRGILASETLGIATPPGGLVKVRVFETQDLMTILHEIGHALGLKHPFQSGVKQAFERDNINWPFDPSVRSEEWSIMNYNHRLQDLTPFDIAALQYLYGAPGTNDGIARSATQPNTNQELALANKRPTAFTISKTSSTVDAGHHEMTLAIIRITDDGLGTAFPILKNQLNALKLVRVNDYWELKISGTVRSQLHEQRVKEFQIELLANGSGPDVTPDLTYTLTINHRSSDQPKSVRLTREAGGTLTENMDVPQPLKIGGIKANDYPDELDGDWEFVLSGEDAHMFEIRGDSLYLRAGTRLNKEANPSADIIIGIKGTTITKAFEISIENVVEPEDTQPILQGDLKVGATLMASTDHNQLIGIASVKWTRADDDVVLSNIENYRPGAPGEYKVSVIYYLWNEFAFEEIEQAERRVWEKTFIVEPVSAPADRSQQSSQPAVVEALAPLIDDVEPNLDLPAPDVI